MRCGEAVSQSQLRRTGILLRPYEILWLKEQLLYIKAFHLSELDEVNEDRTESLDMDRKRDMDILDDLLEVIHKRITANNLFDRNQTISHVEIPLDGLQRDRLKFNFLFLLKQSNLSRVDGVSEKMKLKMLDLQGDKQMIDHFLNIINIDPYECTLCRYRRHRPSNDEIEMKHSKGRILIDENKFEEASQYYDNLTNTSPADLEAWNWKGIALAESHSYTYALSCFEQSMMILPNIHACIYKAFVLNRIVRYPEAIECCKKALELESDNYSVWYIMGDAYTGLGKQQDADACYAKAKELEDAAND
jgi:tetratricopeptide (TPR) repeat protein